MKFAFFFVFMSLVFTTSLAGNQNSGLNPRGVISKIRSDAYSIAKKKQIIALFRKLGFEVSPKDACLLLDYMRTCDDQLYEPLWDIVKICDPESLSYEQLKTSLIPLLQQNINNTERVVPLLWFLDWTYSHHHKDTDSFIDSNADLLLDILKKSDAFFFYCLEHNDYYFPFNSTKSIELVFKKLHGENMDVKKTTSILGFINTKLQLRIADFRLFKEIVPLTGNKNKNISSLASQILAEVTHAKAVKNWKQWWDRKSKTFSLWDASIDVVTSNKNIAENEKTNAWDQIYSLQEASPSGFTTKHWHALTNIIDSPNYDLQSKYNAYAVLMALSCNIPKYRKESKAITKELIGDPRFHEIVFVCLKEKVNDDFIEAKTMETLNNKKLNKLSRGFAAYALGYLTKNKKQAAKAIYDFVKPQINHDTRPLRVALMGLGKLLNKNCGTNIEVWKKAVDAMPDDGESETAKHEKTEK